MDNTRFILKYQQDGSNPIVWWKVEEAQIHQGGAGGDYSHSWYHGQCVGTLDEIKRHVADVIPHEQYPVRRGRGWWGFVDEAALKPLSGDENYVSTWDKLTE
ncbi:MAG: hypothetical protein ACPG7F_00540 [Aggregatilineales bacterium]